MHEALEYGCLQNFDFLWSLLGAPRPPLPSLIHIATWPTSTVSSTFILYTICSLSSFQSISTFLSPSLDRILFEITKECLERVLQIVQSAHGGTIPPLDTFLHDGRTPLVTALSTPVTSLEMVRALLLVCCICYSKQNAGRYRRSSEF